MSASTSCTIPSVEAVLPLNNTSFWCSHIAHNTTSIRPPSFHLGLPHWTKSQKALSEEASTNGIPWVVHIMGQRGTGRKGQCNLFHLQCTKHRLRKCPCRFSSRAPKSLVIASGGAIRRSALSAGIFLPPNESTWLDNCQCLHPLSLSDPGAGFMD